MTIQGLRGGGTKPDPNRWTNDRKLLVATLWNAGESATVVAEKLNQGRGFDERMFTRNAVLSLIHRGKVGVVARSTVVAKPRSGETKPRAHRSHVARPKVLGTRPNYSVKARSVPKPPRLPVIVPVPADAVDMLHLDAKRGCKWPVNNPARGSHEPFLFCNAKRDLLEAYCPYHQLQAYNYDKGRRRA